ncbi:hypothetical protein GQ600_18965 [Phytophthora cactorum]|nr:hypothetical protein GQ600_18965 [Phytophthora cactorum]
MDPCSVCQHRVHRLCSNDLYDPGNLSVCTVCVEQWKADNPSPKTAVLYHQPITFEIVGWPPESSAVARFCSAANRRRTLPPGHWPCVDLYGIPLDVHNYRQLGKRDNVWVVAHIPHRPRLVTTQRRRIIHPHMYPVYGKCYQPV